MSVSKYRIVKPSNDQQIDIPIEIKWDFTGRDDSVDEYQVDVLNQIIGPVNDFEIDGLIKTAQGEIDDPSDGRIFRGGYLYAYESEEGRTQEVYDYLQNVLSYPEDNNIEVSLLYKRDQKLNDLGV
jgi:hypothetical protein